LFENFSDYLNCIIMNACYSATQATAIARHIPYVIGMSQAVGDRAAIAFSVGFYQALGAGRSIENAFKLGVAQIRIQGIPEHLTPVLITRSGESSRPVPAAETPSKATSPSPVPSRLVKESQKQLQTSAANLWSNFAELAAKYGIDPSQLTPGARFSEDLELDSLDLIELIMEVEDFYGIEIPDNEVANIMTLGQAAAYLQRKLGR
jgi:acyl carrier protein